MTYSIADTQDKPVIIFTGGGTGGHIYPNLALIPEFEKRGFSAAYVGGVGDTQEKRLAALYGIPYFEVPSIKLVRSMSLKAVKNNLKIPFEMSGCIKAAVALLKRLKPCAVFSKGGFVSLPVALAAAKLNIPLFCHESDLTLGLANRIAAAKGATVFKANPNSKFNGELVGMPLRDSLFSYSKQIAKKGLGLPPDAKVLLIIGGSSGAQAINDAVAKNLDALTSRWLVLHICGNGKSTNLPNETQNYRRYDYADNIAMFYAASDAVLSRAGATAVYEISALKKRAVFVPLPKGISRGDQLDNAALAQDYGACVLYQNEHFCDDFVPSIEKAFQKPPMRALCTDANRKIADTVCASIRRGEKCKDKKPSQNGLRSSSF